MIGRAGIGCEPASAATLAGIRKLTAAGVIDKSADVVAVLTGNVLKDPDYIYKYHTGQTGSSGRRRRFAPRSATSPSWCRTTPRRSRSCSKVTSCRIYGEWKDRYNRFVKNFIACWR